MCEGSPFTHFEWLVTFRHDLGVRWGDLVAPVEGMGSLMNVQGFSDLSREPLILPHQNLGVI